MWAVPENEGSSWESDVVHGRRWYLQDGIITRERGDHLGEGSGV